MYDKKIIKLNKNMTSFLFYNETLKEIKKYYRSDDYKIDRQPPIISFEDVDYIDSSAITCVMVLGLYLKNFHNENIRLEFKYNPNLLKTLYDIKFFIISKELDIFSYDENLLGGFSDIEHRKDHKMNFYEHMNEYYQLSDESKKIKYKDTLFEYLRYNIIPNNYLQIIKDKNVFNEYEISDVLNIFSEIICNAILYSKSYSFTNVHTNKYKTLISISDIGIGFEESLKQKKFFDYPIYKKYKHNNYCDIIENLRDFIMIFESLNYSMNQDRQNLWRLKNMIVKNGGTFRIHYNTTQVIFTHSRCQNCSKDSYECSICLLQDYNSNMQVSPIRLFDTKFPGVHIEVELK